MKDIWNHYDAHNNSPRSHYYILYRTEDVGECRMEVVKELLMDMVATILMAGGEVTAVLPRY